MAIKDLYGMGKGGAQVVDLRSVDAMVQNQAEANRKRNEAKAQKRATMISAIDSQLGKLKNTSWYGVSGKDRDYIDKLKSDTRIWMTKTYDTYGEAAFLDNPELKRELDEKAAFIESENGRSHASIKQADLMLTKSQKNAEDIDTETGVAFDKWMDLPSEVRMRTPMPIIKDRELTLRETFIGEGMDKEILSSYIPTKRTGAKNQMTGEYNKYEGKRTDEDKYNTTINGLNTNTGGKIFGKANTLAMLEIESDALPPFIDVDGEQVPNPEYQDKLNVTRKRIIEDVAKRFRGTTYENRTTGFGGGEDGDKTTEVSLTEVSPEIAKHISERSLQNLKTNKIVSQVLVNKESNQKAYKLKIPVYRTIDGKIVKTSDEAPGGDVLEIGTYLTIEEYIDEATGKTMKRPHVIGDVSGFTDATEVVKSKVDREVGIQNSPKMNITADNYIKDGKLVPIDETDYLKQSKIVKYHTGNVHKTKSGSFLRDGDKGFDKDKSTKIETVIVENIKGGRYEIELTDKIIDEFPEIFTKLQKEGKTEGVGSKYNKKK